MTAATERWHRKMEKKVLDEASAVVAVSPLVQQEFQAMTDTPVELITNGFDSCDFDQEKVADAEGGPEKEFIITHTGLFAADGNPTVLWDVLKEKCSKDEKFGRLLKIKLIGKTDRQITEALDTAGLSANVINMGYLPHGDAVREQRSASILILPLRKEPEYKAVLPGKVFEYIASLRPVMGIGQSDGAMSMIVSRTNTGTVIDWEDKATMKEFIDICWEKHLAGELRVENADIEQFTRKKLTAEMVSLLEKHTRRHE
jgi:hypothetical protein